MTSRLLTATTALLFACLLRADYPVASHRYLADPSVLVTPERVYVYCSNDDESPVEGGYNIPNVVCVSSADMKNWTDHGVVFEAARQTSWAKKTWAPAAIERDGNFFLYFGNGGANIGVVVSDSPVGPFRDVLGRHLIDSTTPGVKPYENMWLFDPGVFIDDDGQAYMYFGGNGENNVRIARLKRDMLSIDGEVMRMWAPAFFEAAWVFKREGLYYFAYSTNPKAGLRIDYMTSRSPVSGFEYKGVLADQPPINNNNNHSSEFLFKGTWYHLYHNRVVAKSEGIPGAFRRNLAVDTFTFRSDGSIEPVQYTEDGVRQIGHVNPFQRVEAETFAAQHGVETAPASPGGMALVALQPGDWTLIRGVDLGTAGLHVFEAAVAADQAGATLEVRLGGPEGLLLGVLEIPASGGLENWQLSSASLAQTEGVADLCLKVGGASGPAIAVDHWRLR